MFKCQECGEHFEHEMFIRSYFGKVPCCPHCGSDDYFEDGKKCPKCGEFHGGEADVCDTCLDKAAHNYPLCKKISEGVDETIKINALLNALFTKEEIEAILFEHLENSSNIDCTDFVESDKDWFSEQYKNLEE